MAVLKIHQEYLVKLYCKNLIIVTTIFASLTFILNILEEIKFFDGMKLNLYYPIFFTILNLPSILFEIFPFIFLITTQMFFLHLYDRDELLIFKNYGVISSFFPSRYYIQFFNNNSIIKIGNFIRPIL